MHCDTAQGLEVLYL